MSGVSRRGLFSLLTGNKKEVDKPEKPAGFSLSDFYAKRKANDTIPHFRVHGADVPRAVKSTNIGLGEPEPEGVMRIFPDACLGYTSFCSVCSERCPVEGAIVIEAGRPRIVESACDGCGECLRVCPAPKKALRFVKREPA